MNESFGESFRPLLRKEPNERLRQGLENTLHERNLIAFDSVDDAFDFDCDRHAQFGI